MTKQMQFSVTQITLDAYAAQVERENALKRVEAHAASDWKTYALETVKQVAQRRAEFTTDAVLSAMQGAPVWTHELRALGPVMRSAVRAGYITPTPRFETSASVSRHRAPKRIWSSNLFKG